MATAVPAADGASVSESLLAAYIEGAAGGLSLSAMSGVGAVLLNRCVSPHFPDSIVANGAALGVLPSTSVSDMAKYAAALALSGLDPTAGALYFYGADSDIRAAHKSFETYVTDGVCFAAG